MTKPAEQPKCKTCNGSGQRPDFHKMTPPEKPFAFVQVPCPDCNPEQPNTNAMIVKVIQGLMSEVNKQLGELKWCVPFMKADSKLGKQRINVICKGFEEIDLFERTTLFELQKAFE